MKDVRFPEKGTYIVAVSGGVDSMVLLHLLRRRSELNLLVAHVNHGIRADSALDEALVQDYCHKHSIDFSSVQLGLGEGASEAIAREARHKFLQSQMSEKQAKAIITAHHKDDVIETSVINLQRGTNRKGLSSLKDTDRYIRPLQAVSKNTIVSYAVDNQVPWREDSTNQSDLYLRNRIRNVLSNPSNEEVQQGLYQLSKNAQINNNEIDELVNTITGLVYDQALSQIDRQTFVALPASIADEVSRAVLAQLSLEDTLATKTITKLSHFVKTGKIGSSFVISKHCRVVSRNTYVEFLFNLQ